MREACAARFGHISRRRPPRRSDEAGAPFRSALASFFGLDFGTRGRAAALGAFVAPKGKPQSIDRSIDFTTHVD